MLADQFIDLYESTKDEYEKGTIAERIRKRKNKW